MPELMDKNLSSPSDLNQMQFDNYRGERPSAQPAPEGKPRRRSLIPSLLVLLVLSGAALVAYELHTAHYQSTEISLYAKKLTYQLQSGATEQVSYPIAGPFDQRLGYSKLSKFIPRLTQNNFVIEQQAAFSPELLFYTQLGFFRLIVKKLRADY